MRSLFFLALLCIAPLLLLACDSGGAIDEEDEDPVTEVNGDTFSITDGSFTATIDGSDTVSGGALFGVGSKASSREDPAFVIYMLAGEKTLDENGYTSGSWTEIAIEDRDDPTIPSEVGEDSFSRWDMNSSALGKFYGHPSGSLTSVNITSVTDSEIKGTFDFQIDNNTVKTVKGSFTAVPTDEMNQAICAPGC